MTNKHRSCTILSALAMVVLLLTAWDLFFYERSVEAVLAPPTRDAKQIVFFALGDQGTGDRNQQKVANAMENLASAHRNVNFTLLLGDNFYSDGVNLIDDIQWQDKFERIYHGPFLRGMPFYAILGNHDHLGNTAAQIEYAVKRLGSARWRMPGSYYTEDFGKTCDRPLIRMVFLDTTSINLANEQTIELRNAFERAEPQPVWKIVAGHHPVRSFGRYGPADPLVEWLPPVLKETGVDLYLSAHDHNLQIIKVDDEPLYVVAGGGGRSLYALEKGDETLEFGAEIHGFAQISASPAALVIKLYDQNGRLLHTRTVVNKIADVNS